MDTQIKPKITLSNIDQEVKSYIYQCIAEFEPFITPNTIVAVVAKDPLRLISQFEAEEKPYDRNELRKLHRISISLMEDGSKLEEEGVAEDIYEAISRAKVKLLKTLHEIHDNVISNQDRTMQINTARQNGSVH